MLEGIISIKITGIGVFHIRYFENTFQHIRYLEFRTGYGNGFATLILISLYY
jgi:hypothetical protein